MNFIRKMCHHFDVFSVFSDNFFSYFFPERKYKCSCNFPAVRSVVWIKSRRVKSVKSAQLNKSFFFAVCEWNSDLFRLKNSEIFFRLIFDWHETWELLHGVFICVTVKSIIPSEMENFEEHFNERIWKTSQIKWM